jgi:hypothetical protein
MSAVSLSGGLKSSVWERVLAGPFDPSIREIAGAVACQQRTLGFDADGRGLRHTVASHVLPKAIFWEDLAIGYCRKLLI